MVLHKKWSSSSFVLCPLINCSFYRKRSMIFYFISIFFNYFKDLTIKTHIASCLFNTDWQHRDIFVFHKLRHEFTYCLWSRFPGIWRFCFLRPIGRDFFFGIVRSNRSLTGHKSYIFGFLTFSALFWYIIWLIIHFLFVGPLSSLRWYPIITTKFY